MHLHKFFSILIFDMGSLKQTSVAPEVIEGPSGRSRVLNEVNLRRGADFVLYWMTAHRRPNWNHALDYAATLARELNLPLLVLEGLRSDYRHASRRHHSFILDGMASNARAFEGSAVHYAPFLETEEREGSGLLEALAQQAACVVADEHPGFFYPKMLAAAAARCPAQLIAVDSCGLLPLHVSERRFQRAFDLRRYIQRELPKHLSSLPAAKPNLFGLSELDPSHVSALERTSPTRAALQEDRTELLARLPIDQEVLETEKRGGHEAARALLEEFLDDVLDQYGGDRNHPDSGATSGLSPYLHYGHLSAYEVFAGVTSRAGWSPDKLSERADGRREGWWGLSSGAEAFLDQLITWRELGLQRTCKLGRAERFDDLPDWAKQTLALHRADERPHLYSLEDFDGARTHDELWNAAQRQLRVEGTIHNYLRMLWGKKILHWSESPEEAFRIMLHLNDKYALDGRDPNSMSGILWVLGLHDRAWGPERPVFGKVRYMTSDSTRRKLRLKAYLERWSETPALPWD